MPCVYNETPTERAAHEREHNGLADHEFEGVLCGVFTELGGEDLDSVLRSVNWKEVGVKQVDVRRWWAIHQERDAVRRRREDEAKRKDELRRAGRAKLSAEERIALGLS